ncbi:MAG: ribonuclease PH [Synergistales bacterium]|nr:ribonuclease PH [Synergistales bacterium]
MEERSDGRACNMLRPVAIERGLNIHAEGSVLISVGNTRVHCTASVEEKVPPFLRGSGRGWITAEYAMLPRATASRSQRESVRGRIKGRSHEIQRLIGRSLRAGVDLSLLGERTLWIDCDVLQADGGTRCASITGAYVAMTDALRLLWERKQLPSIPLRCQIAAVSVGLIEGRALLDLDYQEDSRADVDCNIVKTDTSHFVEVQASGEEHRFSRDELDAMLSLADLGTEEFFSVQREALGLRGEEREAVIGSESALCQR